MIDIIFPKYIGLYGVLFCLLILNTKITAQDTYVFDTIYVHNPLELEEGVDLLNAYNDGPIVLILDEGQYENISLTKVIENRSGFPKRITSLQNQLLTGKIFLRLKGSNITVENLTFLRNDTYGKATPIITFDDTFQSNIRNCTFMESLTMEGKFGYYIGLKEGGKNHIENNQFLDKHSDGSVIVMNYVSHDTVNGNQHIIANNYFGPRPRGKNPANNTIRLGASGKPSMESSHIHTNILVKENVFDMVSSYYEIISNKSSGNRYIGNIFKYCAGYLCIRNGSDCEIEGNRFYGRPGSGSYGIRIQGPGHVVVNNYFQDLTGAAFIIMGGNGRLTMDVDKMPTYINTSNILIANNIIYNCTTGVLTQIDDKKYPNFPKDILFDRNVFANSKRKGGYLNFKNREVGSNQLRQYKFLDNQFLMGVKSKVSKYDNLIDKKLNSFHDVIHFQYDGKRDTYTPVQNGSN